MMADKRRKPGVLHIKRFTEGKSNEISFSVLDARNNESKNAGKRDKKNGKIRFNGVFRPAPLSGVRPLWQSDSSKQGNKTKRAKSEGSHSAVSSNDEMPGNVRVVSRETPFHRAAEQEIARRKAKRRRRRLLSGFLGTLLLVSALGAGGFYLHGLYQVENSNKESLKEAIEFIEGTDETILEIDSLIGKKVDQDSIDRLKELDEDIPIVKEQLAASKTQAEGLLNELRGSKDKEAAGQAINSVDSRTEMLDQADSIIDLMVDTFSDAQSADSAWGTLLTADALAREAASLVTETTEEKVNASIERTNSAKQEFENARDEFEELSIAVGIDVDSYLDYIDKRIEALEFAALSNDAILIQDKATAESNNEKYNQADMEATKLAEQFDGSPSEEIYSLYDKETETLFANYGNARTSAGTADAFLRDYLGTSGK